MLRWQRELLGSPSHDGGGDDGAREDAGREEAGVQDHGVRNQELGAHLHRQNDQECHGPDSGRTLG